MRKFLTIFLFFGSLAAIAAAKTRNNHTHHPMQQREYEDPVDATAES